MNNHVTYEVFLSNFLKNVPKEWDGKYLLKCKIKLIKDGKKKYFNFYRYCNLKNYKLKDGKNRLWLLGSMKCEKEYIDRKHPFTGNLNDIVLAKTTEIRWN